MPNRPRASLQRLHFQPRVVREAVAPVMLSDIPRLLQRVALQGILFFRDVLPAPDLLQGDNLMFPLQQAGDFFQLVPVVCCKYQFHIDSFR